MTMRSGVIHLGFPVIMEIDNDEKTLSIASISKEKQAADFKEYYKLIVPLKDEIVAMPDPVEITALSFKNSNGRTLNFTEEGVRDNLEDILKTIRKRFTSFRVGLYSTSAPPWMWPTLFSSFSISVSAGTPAASSYSAIYKSPLPKITFSIYFTLSVK